VTAGRIFRGLEEAAGRFGPCALTIGNFDGVHVGHRRILRRVAEVANENGWRSSALTFDPHPTRIVAPARAPLLLTSPDERAALIAEEGIAQVLILPFTRELSHLSAEEFIRVVLVDSLGARAVLVGDNFRFGYQHAGDTRLLAAAGQRYGFITEVVPAVSVRGRPVSSSAIRRLLQEGKVSPAGRMLGRPYALEGEVVQGHGVGSRQTVPTLNLKPPDRVLPATGVYITRTMAVGDSRTWPSVTNVGVRPTFGGDTLSIETFLLPGLSGAAPRAIRVEFLLRLREERKFPAPAALKAQILEDIHHASQYSRLRQRLCGTSGSQVGGSQERLPAADLP
jgi:riboflavin kinase/FMN adenylyltransferase